MSETAKRVDTPVEFKPRKRISRKEATTFEMAEECAEKLKVEYPEPGHKVKIVCRSARHYDVIVFERRPDELVGKGVTHG